MMQAGRPMRAAMLICARCVYAAPEGHPSDELLVGRSVRPQANQTIELVDYSRRLVVQTGARSPRPVSKN